MPECLFVYGTLHPDRAPCEIADDVRRLVQLGSGMIRGELRQLADFPAVQVAKGTRQRVRGTVFQLPNDPALLARLDSYEEFDPNDPSGGLFIRIRLPVTMENGSRRQCWTYLYNGPV